MVFLFGSGIVGFYANCLGHIWLNIVFFEIFAGTERKRTTKSTKYTKIMGMFDVGCLDFLCIG